jgi:hypothetical protein
MRAIGIRVWLLAAVLWCAPPAFAQQLLDTPSPQPFRRWDAGGSVALRFGNDSYWAGLPLSWTADGARYWTAHIKTSIGVATAADDGNFTYRTVGRTYETVGTAPGSVSVSPAVSYQFLENVFAHPYVVVGVRLVTLRDTTSIWSYPSGTFTSSTGPARLAGRPFFGGGFKSYFANGRAFMRSELLLSSGSQGVHPVLRIGAGVDF